MKRKKVFTQEPPLENTKQLILEEMLFLLESNERRFTKQLLARLLDEGCNLPLIIAKPRFYAFMIHGLFSKANPSLQEKFAKHCHRDVSALHENTTHVWRHDDFYQAILFFKSYLNTPERQMTMEVINSMQALKEEWQLDDTIFQEGVEQFEIYLQQTIALMCQGAHDSFCQIPLDLVRQRLYIALTTSLLSHLQVRQTFEKEFGSIPDVINAMQQDHQVFCRLLRFCRDRTPYFTYIASRTFWRTLETLRLEEQKDRR